MPRKKKNDDEIDLMTRTQVARLFRCSPRTVNRRLADNLIPPQIRGTHLWSKKTLQAFINGDAATLQVMPRRSAKKAKR